MSAWSDLTKHKTGGWPKGYTTTVRTLYSPVDDLHGALMGMLASATKLRVAMFAYTDPAIDALLRTKATGDFLMALDNRFAGGPTGIALLLQWDQTLFGTKVAVGTSSKRGAISHLKMAVVDDYYTVTGSTNWTVSGQRSQDNQLSVVKNATHAKEASARIEAVHAFMLTQMAKKKMWPPPARPTTLAPNGEIIEF